RDGRLGGDGLRVAGDRGAPGRRRGAQVGGGAGERLRVGEGAGAATASGEAEAVSVDVVDLAVTPLRELNQRLHDLARGAPGPRRWRILNPNGAHAIAC